MINARAGKKPKKFNISAYVVRQLGDQLISDEITALIELVKNSYDADASRVNIVIDTTTAYEEEDLTKTAFKKEPLVGYVSISDTGTGMDEKDIAEGWLQISFSNKRGINELGTKTNRYKRAVLGSKGVGRLSTQRLGNQLDMFSLKNHYDEKTDTWHLRNDGIHVGIGWNDFKEDVNLEDVPVFYESWAPKNGRPGTKLIITDLQNPDVWAKEDSRKALIGTLAQLISPFEPARDFQLNLKINNKFYDLFELTKSVRDTAISTYRFSFDGKNLRIKGKVKASLFRGGNTTAEERDFKMLIAEDNGAAFFKFLKNGKGTNNLQEGTGGWLFEYEISLQASSLGLVEEWVPASARPFDAYPLEEETPRLNLQKKAFVNPGKFHGEIDQLAYDNVEAITPDAVFSQIGEYKAYIKRQSGVRIYRNGFGIRPYGIDGDDWMGFQSGTTSGRSYYGLRPKNLIGYIFITAEHNGRLEEKTDREGFVINGASQNFFTLSFKIRDEINGVLNRVRRRYNEFKNTQVRKDSPISSPTEALSRIPDIVSQAQKLSDRAGETNTDSVQDKINRKLYDITHSPLLKIGDDSNTQEILKDAQIEFAKIIEIKNLISGLDKQIQELDPIASILRGQLENLTLQLADFSELAGVGLTAEALSHEIDNIIDRLLEDTNNISRYVKGKGVASEILLYIEQVRSSLASLQSQTHHLDPSLRYRRDKREVIKIPEFAKDICQFFENRLRFKETGITFLIENDSSSFLVKCSRGKLTQIFDNILINSEYWLRESVRQGLIDKPVITIKTRHPIIEISDNGLGVDPGVVPFLFQPFITTKPREVGRGLGLFITHQLLESMGGTIDLLPDLNQFQRPYIFQLDLTGSLHE